MIFKHLWQFLSNFPSFIIDKYKGIVKTSMYSRSHNTAPPLTASPPIPPLIFKSWICFFLVIYNMTPLTAVFEYRRYFAWSPESGGIVGSTLYFGVQGCYYIKYPFPGPWVSGQLAGILACIFQNCLPLANLKVPAWFSFLTSFFEDQK